MLKFKIKRWALYLLAMTLSHQVQASLVTESWKNEGDNRVMLDTNTGKRWLSFHETKGMSIQTVRSLLPVRFPGWRIADLADVEALFVGHYDGLLPLKSEKHNELYGVTKAVSPQMAQMYFGFGHNELYGGLTSYGIYLNANSAVNRLHHVVLAGVSYVDHKSVNGSNTLFMNVGGGNYSETYVNAGIGVYLVKDSVASVSGAGVGIVSLLLLTGLWRKERT